MFGPPGKKDSLKDIGKGGSFSDLAQSVMKDQKIKETSKTTTP